MVFRTNLVTNPSFETAGPPVTVRENLIPNPNLVGGAEGAAVPGWLVVTRSGGRAMFSSTAYGPVLPVAAGTVVGGRVRLFAAGGATVVVRAAEASAGGSVGTILESEEVTLAPGVPQDVVVGGTVSAGPAWRLWFVGPSAPIQIIAAFAGVGVSAPAQIFSGATLAAEGFTYSWAGAVNNSVSRKQAPSVAGVTDYSGVYGVQSNAWVSSGEKSLRLIPGKTGGRSNAAVNVGVFSLTAGVPYTLMVTARLTEPIANPSSSRAVTVAVSSGSFNPSVSAPNEAGEHNLVLVFVPVATGSHIVQLWHGGLPGDTDVWWDSLLLVEGVYGGTYFDGDTPGVVWGGTPHASTSTQVTVGRGVASFDPGPRTEISATLPPSVETVTLWQISADGQNPVRGFENVPALGGFFATDYEVPFGVPVSYRIEMFDAAGVSTGFQDMQAVTVNIDPSTAVFSDPLDPIQVVQVEAKSDFADVVGRRREKQVHRIGHDTVALMGRMGKLEALNLRTQTKSKPDAEMFWDVLDATQVLVRTMPDVTMLPRLLYAIVDADAVPQNVQYGKEWVIWEVRGDEISRTRVAVITPVVTWQAYVDKFATWADFNAAHATWLGAQQNPPEVA